MPVNPSLNNYVQFSIFFRFVYIGGKTYAYFFRNQLFVSRLGAGFSFGSFSFQKEKEPRRGFNFDAWGSCLLSRFICRSDCLQQRRQLGDGRRDALELLHRTEDRAFLVGHIKLRDFGTGADSPYTRALNTVFQYYTSKGSKYIFSAEKSAWPDGGSYEWRRHYAMDFVDARLILGNALSEAWTTDEEMHSFGAWKTEVEPDATHNGLQIRTCATCGAEESRKLDPVTACTHSFDTYTPVDADSHSAVCTLCGETVSLPHTAGAATQENVVNATCTAAGSYDEVIRCAVCGYELSRTAKTNALLPHSLGTWVNEQAATCNATGVKGHYQCSVCKKYFDADKNEIADLTIQKDGSNHAGPTEIRNQKAATCTAAGYTGDTVCTACGNTVAAGETIPKAAHQWDAGTVTTQPTCTAAGVKTFQCANCTETKTEPVAALGHAWGGWVVTKQPTCTQEGQQTRTCTRDGSHKETLPVAKKAHTDNGSGYCRDCGADLKASQRCKYCGEIHTGFVGWFIKIYHSILALFKR